MQITSKIRIRWFLIGLGGIVLLLFLSFGGLPVAHAQGAATPEPNPYYSVSTFALSDGTQLDKIVINGPSSPPPGFEAQRQAVLLVGPDKAGANILTVPAFDWAFGCSAVSASMIAGYYDRTGFPNMYSGPTDGGVMPLTNSSWPTWSDGFKTYRGNPLAGTKSGVDGRSALGSLDDYWIQENSAATDPYITGGWAEHSYGDAVGDYMRTSQSYYGNIDGSTTFFNYTSSGARLYCDEMESQGFPDGTVGRKNFYQARGYTVTDCYNQRTDNSIAGGFTFTQYKAEIDAGRPVMLNLNGHTVVGIGYDDANNQVYLHDTWDYADHTMTWGGSYAGLLLQSVSIVNLAGGSANLTPPVVTASDGTDATGVVVSWTASSGATSYLVYRADSMAGTKVPPSGYPTTALGGTDTLAAPGVSYVYWVKACNATACSDFSTPEVGWRGAAATLTPPVVTASDGTDTTGVNVSWTASTGATYYLVFRADSMAGTKFPPSGYPIAGLGGLDTLATPGMTYVYWVKACNVTGCSDFSTAEFGWRAIGDALTPPVVTASKGTVTSGVNVSWTASSGATYYLVFRAYSLAGVKLPPDGYPTTALSGSDTLAVAGVTYFYWVKACNTAGCSDYSTPEVGWR